MADGEAGEGLASAEADPDADGTATGEWPALGVEPPHESPSMAAASNASARPGEEIRPGVSISKANATLRARLRFRYDPAPEVGYDPHLQGYGPKGYVKADGFRLSVFVYLFGGLKQH